LLAHGRRPSKRYVYSHTPHVKASALIEKLKSRPSWQADIVDDGSARVVFDHSEFNYDLDAHDCGIDVWVRHAEKGDGCACLEIDDVTFERRYISEGENGINISGDVVYDNGLTEKDLVKVAEERIDFPSCAPEELCDYHPDEDDLTDSIYKQYGGEGEFEYEVPVVFAKDERCKIFGGFVHSCGQKHPVKGCEEL